MLALIICRDLNVTLTRTARNNGTVYVTSIITPERMLKEELSLQEAMRLPEATVVKGYLTKYAVPKSYAFNLLKDQSKKQSVKPVTHLKSKYAIVMCADELEIPYSGIPPELMSLLRVNRDHQFMPIVREDFMQTRLRDLIEVNDDTREVSFKYVYSPVSIGKMRFLLQIEATLRQFLTLGFTEKDLDEIKGVFADTNLYLLCATMFIGSVHVSKLTKLSF